MRRRLLNVATVVSLLLCVAACALWVRSDFCGYFDRVRRASSGSGSTAILAGGTLYVRHITSPAPWWHAVPLSYEGSKPRGGSAFVPATTLQVDVIGFGFNHSRGTSDGSPFVETWVIVPLWAVSLVTAVLPAQWLARRMRLRRRARRGQCLACGYDLRASPERCPECGTVPIPATVKAHT